MLTSMVYILVLFSSVTLMIGCVVADTSTSPNPSTTTTNTVTADATATATTTSPTPSPSPTPPSNPSSETNTEETCDNTPKTACQQAFEAIDNLCYDFTGTCGDYFSVPDIQQRDGFFAVREAALYIAYTKCNQINSAMYYYSDGVELEKDKNGGTGSNSSPNSSSPNSTNMPTSTTSSPASSPSSTTLSPNSSPTPATSSPSSTPTSTNSIPSQPPSPP